MKKTGHLYSPVFHKDVRQWRYIFISSIFLERSSHMENIKAENQKLTYKDRGIKIVTENEIREVGGYQRIFRGL